MIEHFLVGFALLLGLFGGYLIASSRRRGKRSERPLDNYPSRIARCILSNTTRQPVS